MATQAIVNGAPFFNPLGTQDLSARQLVREPIAVPTHLPKFYIFAKKGPTTPQLAVGDSRSILYGAESFDLRSKYATHATVFANGVNAEGNSCMYQRLVPADAGPQANLFLSLEVIEDTIVDYERNSDGSIMTNSSNVPIPAYKRDENGEIVYNTPGNPSSGAVAADPVKGYRTRWVVTSTDDVSTLQSSYAQRTVAVGSLTGTIETSPGSIINTNTYGVNSVDVVAAGSGYYQAPAITFSDPEDTDGDTATGHVTVNSDGEITGVIIDDGGSGYTTAPTITIVPEQSELAVITIDASSNLGGSGGDEIVGFTVVNAGKGYDPQGSAPDVIVSAPAGSGTTAEITATVEPDGTLSFVISNPGDGYSSGETITVVIDDPDGGAGQDIGSGGTLEAELSSTASGVITTTTPGSTTTTTSSIYPIMDLKASFIGEDGNNAGVRIWAPNESTGGAFDRRLLTNEKVYPFRMSTIRKSTATGTAKVQETLFGEQSVLVTFKPDAIDPNTDSQLNINDVFINAYSNVDDPAYPPVYGDFGDVHVYQNNIETLYSELYEQEKLFADERFVGVGVTATDMLSDFPAAAGAEEDDKWLFNIFSNKASNGAPYFTVTTAAGGTSVGEHANLYAAGGSDGTLDTSTFNQLVRDEVERYADINDPLMNTALHVESIIYDSGFDMETKKALCNFIAARKDTFVALATHEVGAPSKTAAQDNSTAIALRTRLEFYPESDYFGTHVMRGLVMGRDGRIRSSQWKDKISPLYEVAVKAARYMGAGNGVWKAGKNFDGAPGSVLDYIYDVSVAYTPVSVRNKDWDAGLNWVQSYDLRSNFIPALKTVYNDDTSVLNSFITAMAICELNKVAEKAWRYYSGVSYLTSAQLALRIDNFIRDNISGRFDGRFIIEPETYYTDADKARGYSGTTKIKIYAANMWTVSTTYIQAFRLDDYEGQ